MGRTLPGALATAFILDEHWESNEGWAPVFPSQRHMSRNVGVAGSKLRGAVEFFYGKVEDEPDPDSMGALPEDLIPAALDARQQAALAKAAAEKAEAAARLALVREPSAKYAVQMTTHSLEGARVARKVADAQEEAVRVLGFHREIHQPLSFRLHKAVELAKKAATEENDMMHFLQTERSLIQLKKAQRLADEEEAARTLPHLLSVSKKLRKAVDEADHGPGLFPPPLQPYQARSMEPHSPDDELTMMARGDMEDIPVDTRKDCKVM